ncbi:MAG: fatty acid desaturase [Pseudomonadales bacterium]|jgi:beta-carotene hydroxylase
MDQVADRQLDALTDEELDILERQIADKYMRIVPWGAVVWGIGNCLIFFSLFPLVLMGLVPLWLAFPIATLNLMLAYLPSHEAQHGIIGRKGTNLYWLNELLGHISPLPIVSSYRVLRATHMEHHRHCNDPLLDPDYKIHAKDGWAFLAQHIRNLQPGSEEGAAYGQCLERIGESRLVIHQVVYQLIYLAIMFTLAWTGHAIEAALIWWVPKLIAGFHLRYYLSWAPHHPAELQGRYLDTRAFRSKLGNLFSAGMQYHIIHHLYPRIPLSLTPAAYRELRPILERRGCDLGEL